MGPRYANGSSLSLICWIVILSIFCANIYMVWQTFKEWSEYLGDGLQTQSLRLVAPCLIFGTVYIVALLTLARMLTVSTRSTPTMKKTTLKRGS